MMIVLRKLLVAMLLSYRMESQMLLRHGEKSAMCHGKVTCLCVCVCVRACVCMYVYMHLRV